MEYCVLYFLSGKFSVTNNVLKKKVERLERDWGIRLLTAMIFYNHPGIIDLPQQQRKCAFQVADGSC